MNGKHPLPTGAEVDRRLHIVSELRNLCLSLGRARRVSGPDAPRGESVVVPLPSEPPAP